MAGTGKFKCPKCDRTFSMAPHLGRHMSAIHGAKRRKTKAKKKAVKRAARANLGRAARPTPRQPGIDGVGRAIHELRAFRDALAAQRAQMDAQLAAVDGAVSALGGSAGGAQVSASGRRPGVRKGSLKEFVQRVLRTHRGPKSVKDITAAVRAAGYRTKNKTLDKSVQTALMSMPGVVRVARGLYRLRS